MFVCMKVYFIELIPSKTVYEHLPAKKDTDYTLVT